MVRFRKPEMADRPIDHGCALSGPQAESLPSIPIAQEGCSLLSMGQLKSVGAGDHLRVSIPVDISRRPHRVSKVSVPHVPFRRPICDSAQAIARTIKGVDPPFVSLAIVVGPCSDNT